MPKKPFTKTPTTFEEQVERLQKRGMFVEDTKAAAAFLTHVNYYRLGAYWLPFEADHASHVFKEGTSFATVMALYEFDRHLRLLVLDAIERFEVSARTQWTYHMSHAYGSHAYMNASIHHAKWWQRNYEQTKVEVERADEVFIAHMQSEYAEELPAIWAVSEVISLGLLSRWFKSLNKNPLKKKIASAYDIQPPVLASWLHHFSIVRNVCAHHSRLWNRDFSRIAIMEPDSGAMALRGQFVSDPRLYNSLIILVYLMDIISPKHTWRERLLDLISHYPCVSLEQMGFPQDWKNQSMWQ